MLIYTLQHKSNTFQIKVQLLDNSFTNSWRDYLKRTATRLPELGWAPSSHNTIPQVTDNNFNPRIQLQRLLDSFLFLQEHYRIDYSSEITDITNFLEDYSGITQQHLNTWHRHFTTNAVAFNVNRIPTYTDTPSSDVYNYIHALNQNTHDLEVLTYYKLERVSRIDNQIYWSIHSADSYKLEYSAMLWNRESVENMPEPFDISVSSHNHTVWLNDDIQGKDHFKCWREEDDATNDDIWGNSFMTPNVLFDPYMVLSRTLDDPEFREFVINSGKNLNRYPVGDIVDSDSVPWNSMNDSTVLKIELDGETLWQPN